MALGLSFLANAQPNLVIAPAPGLCRIASQMSGIVGTFIASGAASSVSLQWSLQGAPATLTLVPRAGDPTRADLRFSNVPQRSEPYILIVSVLDGTARIQYPIAIVVRPILQLSQIVTGPAINGNTVTGSTYDANLPSLEFQAVANGQVLRDVQFIPPDPGSLIPGLSFEVTANATARLAVAQPSSSDPSGGVKPSSAQTQTITFQAYHPNALYDSPNNALPVNVTYDLTVSSTAALKAGLGGAFDVASAAVYLDLSVLYAQGQARPYSVEWAPSAGAQGSWIGGAPATDATSVIWSPSGSAVQNVTFTATITDAVSTLILTAGPFEVSGTPSWVGSTALPVEIAQGHVISQSPGNTAWVRVDLPDLQSTEAASVVLTVAPLPKPGGQVTNNPTYTVNLSAGTTQKFAIFGIPIPASAALNDMWEFQIAATTASGTAASRTGFGQVLVLCSGVPQLVVSPSTLTVSALAGTPITPVPVTVQAWIQKRNLTPAQVAAFTGTDRDNFFSSTPNATNSTLTLIDGAALSLHSAPAVLGSAAQVTGVPTGLACADDQLTGILPQGGTSRILVTAAKAGYQVGTSGVLSVTTTLPGNVSPFVDLIWSSQPVTVANGTVTLAWQTSGALTNLQVQASTSASGPAISGSWSSSFPQSFQAPLPATTAYMLVGSNALGTSYAPPVLAQEAAASQTALPISPVTATIDQNNNLTMSWVPPASSLAYNYWTVTVQDNTTSLPYALSGPGTSQLLAQNGGGPESIYSITYAFQSGDVGYLALQMQAFGFSGIVSPLWDAFEAFPAYRTAVLTKAQVDMGEPVTILLTALLNSAGGPSGNRWWVVTKNTAPGNTQPALRSSDLPVTVTAIPMAFQVPGPYEITIYVASDYILSDGTPITLMRSFVIVDGLVVTSSPYRNNPLANPLPVEYDVDGSDGVVPAPSDFMVITPVLVRDEATHEIKMLMATSRGDNASSQFGTMAADIFPIAGRPHTLDLVNPESLVVPTGAPAAPPLIIQTTALEDSVAGQPMVPFQLQAKGGVPPYRWYAQNLPQGTYVSRDGIVSGAATGVGAFNVIVSVQDGQTPPFIAEATLPLFVSKSDVAIKGVEDAVGNLSQTLPPAVVGVNYSASLVAMNGVQPYTWSILAGSLPPGVRLSQSPGGQGLLSGWASTNDSTSDFGPGHFTPTFEVTDAVGATAAKQYPMTLMPMPLTLGLPDVTEFTLGVDSLICIPVMGGKPAFTVDSVTASPAGISLTWVLIDGILRILVSRASVATAPGQVTFTVTVHDSVAAIASKPYTFTLKPANPDPVWADPFFPSKVGPDGPLSGSLDSVSLIIPSGSGDVITDIPERLPIPTGVVTSVQSSNTVVALDSATQGLNQEVTLRATVQQPSGATLLTLGKTSREYSVGSIAVVHNTDTTTIITMTANALPVYEGEFFAFDPQAPGRNSSPASVAFSKAALAPGSVLPDGVSLDSVTGLVYGVIQDYTTATVTAIELFQGTTQVALLTINWNCTRNSLNATSTSGIPGSTGTNAPAITVGQPYSATLSVIGTTNNTLVGAGAAPGQPGYLDPLNPYAASPTSPGIIHGRLPLGVTLTFVNGVGAASPSVVLGGTPLESGIFDPVIKMVDAANATRAGIFKTRIIVDHLAYLNIVTTAILPIVSGLYYSMTLLATGGQPDSSGHYAWAIASGSLPSGITLNPTTGVLSGTTQATGFSAPVTFRVTDSFSQVTTQTITVTADQPGALTIQSIALPTGIVGGAYDAPLMATGGVPPYTWSLAPVAPGGLSFETSGALRGVPTSTYNAMVVPTVHDSATPSPNTVTLSSGIPLLIQASGSPVVTPVPSPLPQGLVGASYGTDVSSGLPTGSCNLMAAASPGLAWHISGVLNISGRTFVIALGGFRRGYASTYQMAYRSAVVGNPLYMDPTYVANGQLFGSWGTVSGSAFDPVMINHMMAAGAQVSNSELFVCGGVGNDPAPSLADGLFGRTLNQASICAFMLDGSNRPVPNATAYSYMNGASTINSATFPLPLDPAITNRFGAAACSLAADVIFMCGGIARNVDGSRNPAVSSKAVYKLTLNRAANGSIPPFAPVWTRLADMPVGLVFAKAVCLKDGRVLVIGGLQDLQALSAAWTPDANGQGSNICLVYNPTTDQWAFDDPLPIQVFAAATALLPSGQVILGAPANSPSASLPANQVDGTPLSSVNCLLTYTPNPSGVGNWTIFSTSAVTPANDPRKQLLWSMTMHAMPNGTVVTVGGEQSMSGLMGHLFGSALVSSDSTGAVVYSSPQATSFYFSTNTATPDGTYLVASGGVPPYHGWSVSPALPAGLHLDADTGELYGTPTESTNRTYTFSVLDSKVSGGGNATGSQVLALNITDPQAPIWDTPSGSLGIWTEGSYASVQLAVHDYAGDTTTWAYALINPVGAPLPTGLILTSTGQISGTPTIPGVFNINIRVTNTRVNPQGQNDYADRAFSVTAYGYMLIEATAGQSGGAFTFSPVWGAQLPGFQVPSSPSPQALPNAVIGVPYSVGLQVDYGTAPFTWTLTGLAGTGLTWAPSGRTGILSGTPTMVGGSSNALVSVTADVVDAYGVKQRALATIQFGESPLTISSPSFPGGTVGSTYGPSTLTLGGGIGPYSVTHTEGIPEGLSLSLSSPSLTLSGTPTLNAAGTRTIDVTVTDSGNPAQSTTFHLGVTIAGKSYTWTPGPTAAVGAWTTESAGGFQTVGITWDRFSTQGYNTPGSHARDSRAWLLDVHGVFGTATPSLNLGILAASGWTSYLVNGPIPTGVSTTATFAIVLGSGANTLGNTIWGAITLIDVVATAQTNLQAVFKHTSAGFMAASDCQFAAGSYIFSPSTYTG